MKFKKGCVNVESSREPSSEPSREPSREQVECCVAS